MSMTVYRAFGRDTSTVVKSDSLPDARKKAIAYLRKSGNGYIAITKRVSIKPGDPFYSKNGKELATVGYVEYHLDGRPFGEWDKAVPIWRDHRTGKESIIKADGTLGKRV